MADLSCSGRHGATVHHTCGLAPDARLRPDAVTDDQRLRAAAAALARAERTTDRTRANELAALARRWLEPLDLNPYAGVSSPTPRSEDDR